MLGTKIEMSCSEFLGNKAKSDLVRGGSYLVQKNWRFCLQPIKSIKNGLKNRNRLIGTHTNR